MAINTITAKMVGMYSHDMFTAARMDAISLACEDII